MEQTHSVFNNFDYIVLGIVLLSGVLALFRGFVREVFSLIAWTAAYFAAVRFRSLAEPWVSHYVHNKEAANLAAGALVFCATLVILTIVGSLLARLIKGQALTAIDRSLGFLFGLLRGALVVCIAYFAMVTIFWSDIDKKPDMPQEQSSQQMPSSTGQQVDKESAKAPSWLLEAKTRPFLAYGMGVLKGFIPEKDMLDAKAKLLNAQEAASQRVIDQEKLDLLSTPVPANAKEGDVPSYDDKSRLGLDQLINQKDKP